MMYPVALRSKSIRRHALLAAIFTVLACLTVGCGVGPVAAPVDVVSPKIMGLVHGGQQPVSFGHVALFATTSAGYGGTLTPLATTTSDSNGNFNFSASPAYTCPSGQQAYIVSAGGNPGLAGSGSPVVYPDNAAIFLVAALGPCNNLANVTNIVVNEVTTVAAAYALSGFAPVGGVGMTEAAVVAGTAMPGITTSANNTQGLGDAFGNAGNMVGLFGGAYSTTPAGNGAVPIQTINALGDILQDCVNSSSAGSTACTSLFGDAQPPTATTIAKPVNVWQAALDIAQYPGNNVAALFGLISAQSAFSTNLTAAPNDWSLGIVYTGTLLTSGSGLGIDSKDNVYVSGTGYLLSFTPLGVGGGTNLVGSPITASDSLREIAFDKNGNLFVSDGAYTGVYEYNPTTAAVTALNFDVAPASEANNNTYAIAVDGKNDVWTSSYSKATCASVTCPLVEFPSTATASPAYAAYAPFSTFSTFTAPQPTGALGGARGIAFDVKTGNVWITAIDDNLAEVFTVTPSANGVATATAAPKQLTGFGTEAGTPASNTAYGTISVAVDSSSRAWIVVAGGPAVTGSKSTGAISSALYPVSAAGVVGTAVTGGGLSTSGVAANVVVDGNNNVFVSSVGSTGTSAIIAYNPATSSFFSPNIGLNPGATYVAGALSGGALYEPSYLAVDKSGALWALSSGNGTTHPANLVQIFGVAAPTDPVLADGNYGAKP